MAALSTPAAPSTSRLENLASPIVLLPAGRAQPGRDLPLPAYDKVSGLISNRNPICQSIAPLL